MADPQGTPTVVADAVVARLRAWGVHRLFGYVGDGIDPPLAALDRAGDPEYVGARHEENAAFMATAHAKFTGGVGCCVATHGPGAIHLLNGLYDAKLDGKPVVAVVGQQHRTALGSTYQQEIDTQALYKDVCSAYVATVTVPEQAHVVVDRAVRTAVAARQPTAVILPHDVQQLAMPDAPQQAHGVVHSAVGITLPEVTPPAAALDEAAALLGAGERVAILVGQGAARAAGEVLAVADRLGAGIATSLLGKPVVDDTLPHVCGCIGHLGTDAAQSLMEGCDTLRALLGRLPEQPSGAARAWRADVAGWVAAWDEELARRARLPAEPLNPQLVVHELAPRLPADVLLGVDVGSVTYWYSRHLRLRGRVPAHLSSTLASMGSGLPYALATKLAHPDRPVLALVGDGAMQMNGINELITVAARWRGWADPRLVVLVLRNDDLNEVTWEQREMEGDPRVDRSQDVPPFDHAGYARLLGLGGVRVDAPGDVGPAWDEALAADRPVLVEAVVDPATPLLPPRLGDAQRRQLAAGLDAEGSAEAGRARAALAAEGVELP